MIEVPFSIWSAILLFLVAVGVVVQIIILNTLKHFRDYDDPDKGQIKLHFRDFGKR